MSSRAAGAQRGRQGAVYRHVRHIAAAAKPTVFREAANDAAVEALGLPVPAIRSVQQTSGRWRIVFDRVRGPSFAERMRGDATGRPADETYCRNPAGAVHRGRRIPPAWSRNAAR